MRLMFARLSLAFVLLAGSATPAAAHFGHDQGAGLVAGFVHPFTGYDHLAAMLLVGIWAARSYPRRLLVLPAAFMAAMVAGFAAGQAVAGLPAEALVVLSLPILGLLALGSSRLPLSLASGVVALFALGHGYAHAVEASGGNGAFAMGMLTSTALLHGIGIALSRIVVATGFYRQTAV